MLARTKAACRRPYTACRDPAHRQHASGDNIELNERHRCADTSYLENTNTRGQQRSERREKDQVRERLRTNERRHLDVGLYRMISSSENLAQPRRTKTPTVPDFELEYLLNDKLRDLPQSPRDQKSERAKNERMKVKPRRGKADSPPIN